MHRRERLVADWRTAMTVRSWAALSCCGAIGALLAVGCGGGVGSSTVRASDANTHASPSMTSRSSSNTRRTRSRRLPSIPRRQRARRLPDGTIWTPAPRVTATRTDALDQCDSLTVSTSEGTHVVVQVPPRPGLRAGRAGHRVVVQIDTGAPLTNCVPAAIVVHLLNTRAHAEISTHDVILKRLGKQRVVLPQLSQFSRPADVVRAYAVTERGVAGKGAAVGIE